MEKKEALQKVTRSALTEPTEYRPTVASSSACSQEYETLAMLATDEIKNRIINQEAGLSEACRQQISSEAQPIELELIRKACLLDINSSSCLTPVITLRSKLMESVTKDVDPASLPTNIMLNKIYARSISEHGPADLLKTMDLITELESRDEHLGFDQQRLSLMSKLVDADKAYREPFDELAGKLEDSYPEDVLAYRFKNSTRIDDWNATESLIRDHLQKYPGSAQAHYLLAVVEFKRGHVERAQALANRALEMDPSSKLFKEEVPKLRDDPKNWVGYFELPPVTYSF